MPIASLPTELDLKIISFLKGDRKALNTLSLVSRYYREHTEPELYHDIVFTTNDGWRILCLLQTFLDRPDVTRYTKSFTYHKAENDVFPHLDGASLLVTRKRYIDQVQATLFESSNVLMDQVKRHTIGYGRDFSVCLFQDILIRDSGPGGALALVLCMVSNVESISLTPESKIHLTEYGINRSNGFWTYVQDMFSFSKPGMDDLSMIHYDTSPHAFTKLKALCLGADEAGGSCILPPTLEQLTLRRFNVERLVQISPVKNSLKVLELEHGTITQEALSQAISSDTLSKLHTLRLRHMTRWDDDLHEDLTFDGHLIQEMEEHIPDLEVFECIRTPIVPLHENAFGAFKKLKHLRLE
ncbi:hypothetical protein N0V90_013128 [Kalmusia sp. IMI 367209]|nr:hypothetical protein N0V90_013128 [Kalmusia sp. IMI 367209]